MKIEDIKDKIKKGKPVDTEMLSSDKTKGYTKKRKINEKLIEYLTLSDSVTTKDRLARLEQLVFEIIDYLNWRK